MTDTQKPENEETQGTITQHEMKLGQGSLSYKAHAGWMTLHKQEKPSAEMFHVAYILDSKEENRPLTFVFNGGPGASSAYLHMGGLGPKRIHFNDDGTIPKPPVQLVDNMESWLTFSDLVFIDPIGTGFSRLHTKEDGKDSKSEGKDPKQKEEYYNLKRDLESIGEFIVRFLSEHKRWESPIFLAGESYGGFRAACMSKRLQESHGVALNGVLIISPAFEFNVLIPTDYDLQGWIDTFPCFALAASWHNRSKKFPKGTPTETILQDAEQFAHNQMLRMLSLGNMMDAAEKDSIIQEMSEYLGISVQKIKQAEGRLTFHEFARALLEDEGKVIGYYDSSITGIDPFPNRAAFAGPDPTLSGIGPYFTAGINTHLRKYLELDTPKDYHLLSMDVHLAWKKEENHIFSAHVSATDELRYGMALNPHMKVLIVHGYHDLVTPYSASKRLVSQMRLNPQLEQNIALKNYNGGHMFYAWKSSRIAFTKDAANFIQSAK